MKIKVNKGYLRHDGKLLKAGDIADVTPDELAKKIVENSDGDFSIIAATVQEEESEQDKPENEETEQEESEQDNDTAEDDETGGEIDLPDVDPAEAVDAGTPDKTKKTGGRRTGKSK